MEQKEFNYEKEYVRMMDSIRKDKYRGEETCFGVDCSVCPFDSKNNVYRENFCYPNISLNAHKIVEIVKKWSIEHPYEPEIDWTKVPIDTLVEVCDSEYNQNKDNWARRRFAFFNPNSIEKFYVFQCGRSSKDRGNAISYISCRLVHDNPLYHKK